MAWLSGNHGSPVVALRSLRNMTLLSRFIFVITATSVMPKHQRNTIHGPVRVSHICKEIEYTSKDSANQSNHLRRCPVLQVLRYDHLSCRLPRHFLAVSRTPNEKTKTRTETQRIPTARQSSKLISEVTWRRLDQSCRGLPCCCSAASLTG